MECKHFSHPHYLTFQQLQNGPEIRCSGCKLPATGPIYTCWQCNFFLHEQCYKASRALNHNSHPSHPLTLIPYPTYPSGSFICNSCNQTGTGFSFSCSNCDFDLHLHCAYNPQTNPHESSYPFGPTQNFSLPNENQNFHSQFPFPPPISTHESYPNAPNFNVFPSIPTPHESYPHFPTPSFNAQYNYIPQTANHEPLFNNPNETNSQMGPENGINGPNFQLPLPNQMPPSFNSPMGPQPVVHQSFQSISNPQNPPPYEAVVSFNAHTSPETGSHGHGPNLQHPLPNQTPSSNHQSNMHQPYQNIPTLPQLAPPYEAVPSFNAQTRPEAATEMPSNANKPINVSASSENQQKLKGVKHFSHDHPLLFSEIKEEDGIICSGCEQKVSGSTYTCMVSNCDFNLHNSCFGLPREIKKHKSHPEHTLSLLSTPPYEEDQEFTCNACLEYGGAFVYHCSTCKFDLHVDCAFLPETVAREDHEHSLALLYSLPLAVKKELEDDPDLIFSCDVCRRTVDQRSWFYSCQDCNFGTHLGCVTAEQCSEEVSELAMMLETQAQLQRLQIQVQMSQQTAQMISSMGQSLLNLV